ncbi:ATP-dependent RNA helicase DbpA [Pseudoxanthomonas broegbernensis]|uniref:ATP-dependent RNA helicase DbpA n=1 Tax=Pseudoxanthomonas broegbernensis TaxID=83619 RepID=A0A7V8GK38_9GAMM|nr:ATP-dependent RNA helicase DbpA [Pseudoxanthomonas broegbernensis]KAF1684729.1 ATP-dependent RNA helicase DbpA [Pseudoxanthomonas broegbernensis]MBB6066403.1 ATP-independent RNA helicase DbpA [Pseudoxanthomonas broegbernensis]
MTDFASLPLSPALHPGLDALGYTTPTPIQALALPPILDGRDLIAQAPTGSGKTAAFGLGLLQRLDPAGTRTQALVLCPTRELADQVGRQLRRLATGIANLKLSVLTGGVSLEPQTASLQAHDPQVVVGTPGRIQELARKRVLHLGGVRVLVLDEADRMLDMGFEEPVREIAGRCDAHRQTLLFSATFPDGIRELARQLLRAPAEVAAEAAGGAPAIEQHFFDVDPAFRQKAVADLLLRYRPESAVVFCNTRKDVDEVAGSLRQFGFSALALHGDMEQRDRDEVLLQLANRSCNVLVASDVAARGLDVEDLAVVLNHELPTDVDAYRHRIGRTGRAGRGGLALSLVAPRERARAEMIAAVQQPSPSRQNAPLATGRPSQPAQAPMATLRIDGGKTDKLRPGDILGALTGEAGLPAAAIGKIAIHATRSYVAIARAQVERASARLESGKIKGRRFRVRPL